MKAQMDDAAQKSQNDAEEFTQRIQLLQKDVEAQKEQSMALKEEIQSQCKEKEMLQQKCDGLENDIRTMQAEVLFYPYYLQAHH